MTLYTPATGAPPRVETRGFQQAPRRVEDAESLLRRLDWHVVRRLEGLLQGDYRSLFTGQGYDLAEVREYQPQDDVRYMDWNVTARMDAPYVRQYIEDREITAWLLLDLSPSIDFGTANERKRDLVVDFAGVITRLLMRHGNKVGAMLFSSAIDEVLPPRNGQAHALRLLHQLVREDRSTTLTPGRATDLAAILDRAARTLRRRSLVFVVSDFISESDWEPALGRLSERHEVLAVWLTDPREEEIPDVGPLILEDAETGQQVYVDTRDKGFQARFQQLVWDRRFSIEHVFARHGIDALRLSTDGNLVREIARFAHLRRESRRRSGSRTGVVQ
jgi:uncharacterized protein (DUF58 family)